jgi:hypothetical protein
MAIDRTQLFDEIWTEPMLRVAARYSVSSSYLSRVCARLRIPTPPPGYWLKLRASHAPPRPELPEARPGQEIEWNREGVPRCLPRPSPQPPETLPARRVRKPADRTALHELLVGARKHFAKDRGTSTGHIRPWRQVLVDVYVTEATLERALELANDLFLTFEDYGFSACYAPAGWGCHHRPALDIGGPYTDYGPKQWSPARPTVVLIGTIAFGLTLYELTETVAGHYVHGEFAPLGDLGPRTRRRLERFDSWIHVKELPTGRLCLRATSPYHDVEWEHKWSESEPGDSA